MEWEGHPTSGLRLVLSRSCWSSAAPPRQGCPAGQGRTKLLHFAMSSALCRRKKVHILSPVTGRKVETSLHRMEKGERLLLVGRWDGFLLTGLCELFEVKISWIHVNARISFGEISQYSKSSSYAGIGSRCKITCTRTGAPSKIALLRSGKPSNLILRRGECNEFENLCEICPLCHVLPLPHTIGMPPNARRGRADH